MQTTHKTQLHNVMIHTGISITRLARMTNTSEQRVRNALNGIGEDADFEAFAKLFHTSPDALKAPLIEKAAAISGNGRYLDNGQVTFASACKANSINKKGVEKLLELGLAVYNTRGFRSVYPEEFEEKYALIKDDPIFHTQRKPRKPVPLIDYPLPIPSPFSDRELLYPENEICLDFEITRKQLLSLCPKVQHKEIDGFHYFNRPQVEKCLIEEGLF